MKIRQLPFKGHFQEQPELHSETLRIVVPENDVDEQLLWWALLPHSETVADDESRREYTFNYEVLDHLGDGVYKLRLMCMDASRRPHMAEIAAAMIATIGSGEEGRSVGFAPFWFISDRLHFHSDEDYGGPAFGNLRFGDPSELPHRRLFGATISV